MTGCLLQLSATIRKIRIPSDNCDEQGVLLYTQSPHQVLKCGDLVFEHLVKQLEVVVVDDGEGWWLWLTVFTSMITLSMELRSV